MKKYNMNESRNSSQVTLTSYLTNENESHHGSDHHLGNDNPMFHLDSEKDHIINSSTTKSKSLNIGKENLNCLNCGKGLSSFIIQFIIQ